MFPEMKKLVLLGKIAAWRGVSVSAAMPEFDFTTAAVIRIAPRSKIQALSPRPLSAPHPYCPTNFWTPP